MFDPPTIINTVEGRDYTYTDYTARPVVDCKDWCHNCVRKDQTGGTCRHCKYFRLFEAK